MKSELISVIVPIFNAQNNLDRCVGSIISQSYQNIELILVDDGSTDNSLSICNQYAKRDRRIKVFHKENGGVSSARNLGLKKAKGDYISFVDSDDYIDGRMYELLLLSMKENGSDIGICNVCYEDMNNKLLYSFKHDHFVFGRCDYPANSNNYKCISGYVWNKLYSRSLIFQRSGDPIAFDCNIAIAEDDLYNYEILDSNKEIKYSYVNEKLYHYVLSSNSVTKQRFSEKKLSYFTAIEREIDILRLNGIDDDFLKANYVINSVKALIIMKELKIEYNPQSETIRELANTYKNNINYSSIPFKTRAKLFISMNLPFIYWLKIKLNSEYY